MAVGIGVVINGLGIVVVASYVGVLATIFASTVAFLLIRGRRARMLAVQAGECGMSKALTFHSPDETQKYFQQYGFISSRVGTVILYSWVTIFASGYVYMIVCSWVSYAPMFGAPQSIVRAFGGWKGFMAPWLVIFTGTHVLWMMLIKLWPVMRTSFMFPASRMSEATHVIIEEESAPDLHDDPDDMTKTFAKALSMSFTSVLDKSFNFKEDLTQGNGSDRTWASFLRRTLSAVEDSLQRIIRRTCLEVKEEEDGTKQIEYTCVRYVYDSADDRFHPVGGSNFTAVQAHAALRQGGLSSDAVRKTMSSCGKNEIHVHVPSIPEALVIEYADFTYVINSIATWSYMIYSTWNVGLVWLAITIGSGVARSLFIMRPNQQKIAKMAQLRTECEVLREGIWITIEASDIALGDIVRVEDGSAKLPCDGLLLEGSLVLNESMLTGEPMPVQKMPLEDSQNETISKKHMVYAGTSCLQSTGPVGGRAVMIASAVGALTTRGQLVRMVLFPTSVRFKYNDQLPWVYLFLFFYMILEVAIYLIWIDVGDYIATYMIVINTVAMVLSPMLPVSMVMGQSVTAARLQSEHSISCLQPGRIPIAGKIHTMVFDKTGTITKDGMDFDGVIGISQTGTPEFTEKVSFNSEHPESSENREKIRREVSTHLRHATACCHTVTTLQDGTLVGNQVEVSMVRTAGWDLSNTLITSPSGDEVLEVVKQLDFDHCRMTSGSVVRCRRTGELEVYVKGSYEKIRLISESASVPQDYDSKTKMYAKNGYYTLGIATKTLPASLTPQQIADMTRDSLETELNICGLLLFRNEMKKCSPAAIRALRKGAVRSVICTGDNALTGINIGRQCGIVTSPTVMLGDVNPDGQLVWTDPDGKDRNPCDMGDCQLAVTQAAWRHLHRVGLAATELDRIWRSIVVFARMKPEDKINVVKYLQGHDLVVGMCGDGGNDCGGLRAAHAGLALSDAEASMVSPFSTGRDGKSLLTVVDLIREGRACLATNMATFQYFIVYGFTLTFIRTVLALFGAFSVSEYVWLTMDIVIGIIMVWTMTQSKPASELSGFRPTATLLGLRTIVSIVVPYVTCVGAYFFAEKLLWKQDWYDYQHPLKHLGLEPTEPMKRGDNYDTPIGVLMLYLTLVTTAYVNTYGGPFRQNVMYNWGINLVYGLVLLGIFWLCLSPPTEFNCLYRVNCDTESSLAAGKVPVFSTFSANGGVGGCFYGPQLKVWQHELQRLWLPEAATQCLPPSNSTHHLSAYASPDISTMNCDGPNNCWSNSFKFDMAKVLCAYMFLNHIFVKGVLHGPRAAGRWQWPKHRDDERGHGSAESP